jgi:hypothetical protein
MLRYVLMAGCALLGLWPAVSAAAGLQLDSREYKLLLDPAKFSGEQPEGIIGKFWDQQLKPIIAQRLDRRKNGEARDKGKFALDRERSVLFRDAGACVLNANGFSLRERVDLNNGQLDNSTRELTLKFRTPDIFLAGTSEIDAGGGKAKVKFEEDIAPLVEHTVAPSGKITAAFARPPSIRSVFSKSVAQRLKPERAVGSLVDVAALYPGLLAKLKKSGVDGSMLNAALVSGQRFRELVFSNATVDLGDNVDAGFDLTLWYPAEAKDSRPVVAELSFKYKTDKGGVTEPVAWRALLLFRAMQEMLGEWTSAEQQTKTSLALPARCSG